MSKLKKLLAIMFLVSLFSAMIAMGFVFLNKASKSGTPTSDQRLRMQYVRDSTQAEYYKHANEKRVTE